MKHNISRIFSNTKVQSLVVGVVAIIATALFILLTPLRYAAIPPLPMKEITPVALNDALRSNPNKYIVIDVRGLPDYNALHVAGAVSIPTPDVYSEKTILPRSAKTLVLVCGDGRSAAVVYGFLQQQGFTNIIHLQGGLNNWRSQNLPTQSST